MTDMIRKFFKMESSGGLMLVLASFLAMWIANSSQQALYEEVLHIPLLGLSLRHWINDGLMAVFFLLIGLEVKRELFEGALKQRETAVFPAIAAVGGMLAPALIYALLNQNDSLAVQGWAIPAATDIAFALGIMALLGNRVPLSLKVFLLALAIIDDLGVIVIIALFYSSDLSTLALSVGLTMVGLLVLLSYKRVTSLTPYLVVGAILWVAVLKSGVHATLAGVILGFAIPLKGKNGGSSPLKQLEHWLHPYVAFAILPVFAFANAGISMSAVSTEILTHTVPLGVSLGLLIGKPLGVFSFSWLALKFGFAKLPEGVKLKQIFAVSVLCGIGFTMSIFISSLAFGEIAEELDTYARVGILMGSTLAAVLGYILLRVSSPAENVAVSER
ncbi:Na+/H+ antiporter NhaA [Vibrio mangrovi]|uniref:Na(+)/H(+) antiporter NhaA n=1 Tax=Vibrio mangrovi TaxID=474394 RepID=A0A1Y6IS74_9VIBR|nr:Na+/H+ antiporter NhaA [Vibrio mangrovi]MDW6003853.1 Na+/H+ antiporter NhaA [Vibrio mangrovi]SMR99352.1 Na(+)/H(+) antiporter NhaA [Vibrio mangrovi]